MGKEIGSGGKEHLGALLTFLLDLIFFYFLYLFFDKNINLNFL